METKHGDERRPGGGGDGRGQGHRLGDGGGAGRRRRPPGAPRSRRGGPRRRQPAPRRARRRPSRGDARRHRRGRGRARHGGGGRALRPARHPGEQRRHRPAPADARALARRLGEGGRRQPERGLPLLARRRPDDGRRRPRRDRQRRLDDGTLRRRPLSEPLVPLEQGRGREPDPRARGRVGRPGRARQRGRADLGQDRADAGPVQGPGADGAGDGA